MISLLDADMVRIGSDSALCFLRYSECLSREPDSDGILNVVIPFLMNALYNAEHFAESASVRPSICNLMKWPANEPSSM